MSNASARSAPFALLRLLFRWQTLPLLVLVAAALVMPVLFADGDGFAVLAPGLQGSDKGELRTLAQRLVLQLGATLPLTVATLAYLASQEVFNTSVSWTLPGLRRRIVSGHMVLMALMTLAVGVLAFSRVDAWTAVLAIGLTPFWYAVGTCWHTLFLRPKLGVPCLVLAVVAVFRPSWYVAVFTWSAWTLLSVLAAAAISVMLFAGQHSAQYGRVMAFIVSTRAWTVTGIPFLLSDRAQTAHRYGAPRRTVWHWIRAAASETLGGTRAYVRLRLLLIVLNTCLMFFLDTGLVIIALAFTQFGLQLSGLLPYPLSRQERATVQFLCSFIDLASTALVAAGTFGLLRAVGVAQFWSSERTQFTDWRVELAALCVFVPFVQWPRATGPLRPGVVAAPMAFAFLAMVGTSLLLRLLRSTFNDPPLLQSLMLLGVAIVGSQLLYFFALRVVYARRDLSR